MSSTLEGNPFNPSNHSPPKFIVQQIIKVSKEVHPSLKARVVGMEWGPDNVRDKISGPSWTYLITFEGQEGYERYTQEELAAWNGA